MQGGGAKITKVRRNMSCKMKKKKNVFTLVRACDDLVKMFQARAESLSKVSLSILGTNVRLWNGSVSRSW